MEEEAGDVVIYSCFDDKSGKYRYFENGLKKAVNADLPVPSYSGRETQLGVPSTEAGRSLPRDAQPAGEGWRARGMVVQCSSNGFSGFWDDPDDTKRVVVGVIVGAGLGWLFQRWLEKK